MLEYPFRWGKKAFEESKIPAKVKAHLQITLKSLPQARLQLIKSPVSSFPKQIAFFIAYASEDPGLSEWQLSSYTDLLQLDLVSLTQQLAAPENSNRSQPLYLVCTNGKRDLCCARQGRPVFLALLNQRQTAAWQTTHVGGHRFAGNLLCFPHGLIYGRTRPTDIQAIVDTYINGDLLLDRLRGRSCFTEFTQAAEYYLRKNTGVTALSAYRHSRTEHNSPERAKVIFTDASNANKHVLLIEAKQSDLQVYTSCHDQERSPVTSYQLIDYYVDHRKDPDNADPTR